MTGIRIPELLAPAGSPEALAAAVSAGADAVYLGGKRFGARHFAANFTEDELRDAIAFCHVRGVRVYVTVNTLIRDDELAGAMEYLLQLYEMGVDAVLLQDAGLAALAREILPGLGLHASTQMTIHNTEGVKRAAALGFRRVVLARELRLSEIEEIAAETSGLGIGLEVFVHGALCYSYSGQCLLSSLIGGRSGNRGACAQPCRKPYELVCGPQDHWGRTERYAKVPVNDRYLLSTKDLCTYPELAKITASPVAALKIEGRMRSAEYVAVVVSVYRRALDRIREGAWTPDPRDLFDLGMAFNRGFTGGHLLGAGPEDLMGRDLPGNRGVLIGRVVPSDRKGGAVRIQLDRPLAFRKGDGLVFRGQDPGCDEAGLVLTGSPVQEKGMVRLPVRAEVLNGASVFLTRSTEFEERAQQILRTGPNAGRQVPVDLCFTVGAGGIPVLEGTSAAPDGTLLSRRVSGSTPFLPARTRPLTAGMVRTQLARTAGTPFVIRDLDTDIKGDWFAPPGILNQLRRDLLLGLEDALAGTYRPGSQEVDCARERWSARSRDLIPDAHGASGPGRTSQQNNPEIILYTDTVQGVEAAAKAGADRICFEPGIPTGNCPPDRTGRDAWYRDLVSRMAVQLLEAAEHSRTAGATLIWKFPRIVRNAFLVHAKAVLPRLLEHGIAGCMTEDAGAAGALLSTGTRPVLYGGAGLNIFNREAVRALAPPFSLLTLSPELSGDWIRVLLSRVPKQEAPGIGMLVQGSPEAMVAEDRLLSILAPPDAPGRICGLMDGTGRIFPVFQDSECRTRILNAVELCLIDHIPDIIAAGVGSLAIDARGRPPAYAVRAVAAYRQAVSSRAKAMPERASLLAALKGGMREISRGGITTGHYLRGVSEGDGVS